LFSPVHIPRGWKNFPEGAILRTESPSGPPRDGGFPYTLRIVSPGPPDERTPAFTPCRIAPMLGSAHPSTVVSFLCVLCGSSAAGEGARIPREENFLSAPFDVLEDTGARGFVRFEIEPGAYGAFDAAHRTGQLLHLLSFPLPGGETVDLLLRPREVMEPGGTAIVVRPDGREDRVAPQVRAFSGSVPGRQSLVFLAISPELLHGYASLDGENFFVSSGKGGGSEAAVSHGSLFGAPSLAEWCGTLFEEPETRESSPGIQPLSTTVLRSSKVFLECDSTYRALFSTDQSAVDYCALLVSAASEIYRRDLGVTLDVPSGYIRLWTATPPWGVTTTFGDLGKFVSWWNSSANPSKGVKRAAVQLLTRPVFGGVAQSVAVVCTKVSSYAISSVYGSFPYPIQHTSAANWDLFVLSHEFGHLYGSFHSFEYVPPIACKDGSGPDCGTIMSYCHLTYGVGGVGMRFHEREQDAIRAVMRNRGCIKVVPLLRGDYDANGLLDGLDLAAFDAYQLQGFTSRGAEETFDMDSDGTVTNLDRDVLTAILAGIPPASFTVRNGSGVNCGLCYATLAAPLIGGTWTAYVGNNLGPPMLTTIYAASAPLDPGLPTVFGELLIALTGLGGQTLFRSNACTNVGIATHSLPIPYDLSLLGAEVYTQAAIFEPTGTLLLNAIDLVISNYE